MRVHISDDRQHRPPAGWFMSELLLGIDGDQETYVYKREPEFDVLAFAVPVVSQSVADQFAPHLWRAVPADPDASRPRTAYVGRSGGQHGA